MGSQIEYKKNISPLVCSFCDGLALVPVIDFGEVALAGGFLKPEKFDEELTYPLSVYFCEECFSVQVVDKVDPEVLFQDYFYFSSSIKTLKAHFEEYASEVVSRFIEPKCATVVEFGCNDGVLLKPLADKNIRCLIGVDPAKNVVGTINDPRIQIVNSFFDENAAHEIVKKYGHVDMVLANNVYAHIPDIKEVTRAVQFVLGDDGVFVFEVHYLGKVIDELQYDMIYHEHLYYYSLLSVCKHFEKYDMVVFDVKSVDIHAGSMRFYVTNANSKYATISTNATSLYDEEIAKGFQLASTYSGFKQRVEEQKNALIELLVSLKREGATIAGYGASGRANTMIQYCGIGLDLLDYMVDDAPAKQGYYTPGSHFEIVSSAILNGDNPPDYIVVFAWSFLDEIMSRNKEYLSRGGKMIVPLPEVKVISI